MYSFTVDVSSDEMFIKYTLLPDSLDLYFPAYLTFFDKNKSEIGFQ